jgi:hypothetical protein
MAPIKKEKQLQHFQIEKRTLRIGYLSIVCETNLVLPYLKVIFLICIPT